VRFDDDAGMHHGFTITAGDPRTVAELAAVAEAAGWDGVFTFDAVAIGDQELSDPWVVLAAMAMRTSRVRLGAMVFAPARRRPWKLAREAATLDILSGGRLVLPVGLGTIDDLAFGNVGEPTGARSRAERLDESLAILDGLWSGEPFAFEGSHYRFGPMTFRPRPVQRPRIPIWVVGAWPHERSMRRAVQWDGVVIQALDAGGASILSPKVVAEIAAWVRDARQAARAAEPFDLVVDGRTPVDDAARARSIAGSYADAGATWWIEADWHDTSIDGMRRRIEAGPPRP
jgi:alkanesulfonate monooxygenase SsuD/methylene tetrahydromethanopterin reductase-like flavin-dependent oxidoreductase (luciferase family)